MATRTARRIMGIAVLGAMGGFLFWAFRPQPVPVDMAEVDRGPVKAIVREEGVTRVRDVYRLSAPVAGRVLRIEADVGDVVEANETVLARLLPSEPDFLNARALSEAQARVRAAEAAVELAKAEVAKAVAMTEFARRELDRIKRLARTDTASQARLDEAKLQLRTAVAAEQRARADVEVKRAELETARAILIDPATPESVEAGKTTGVLDLRAPVNGVVLSRLQESENVVSAGTPLIEVGNPQDLEIVVDLLSRDAVKVSSGTRVEIVDWGGKGTLAGRVRRVEPTGFTKVSALGVEEQRVNVIIDPQGDAETWHRIGHGYRVESNIIVDEAPNAVRVPVGALFRQDRAWAVYVVEEGHALLRTIELGLWNEQHAEVIQGVSKGETVIVHPGEKVIDGIAVEPR